MQAKNWNVIFVVVALPLLLVVNSGCNQIFGLDKTTLAPDPDPNLYECSCNCTADGVALEPVRFDTCFPAEFNPALNPSLPADFQPTAEQIANDCTRRVERNVEGIAETCGVADIFRCNCTASFRNSFSEVCNTACPDVELDGMCTNRDEATHVRGQDPVCLTAGADRLGPQLPNPMAARIFGRRSICEVDGSITVMADDTTQTRDAAGVVEFTGEPCPGASCAVGITYQIDHVDTFEFSGLYGGVTVDIKNVRASGATLPAGAVLDATGFGSFPADTAQTSGRGTRIRDGALSSRSETTAAYIGANSEPLNIDVHWAEHACFMDGSILGATIDDEGTSVFVNLVGDIVNEPPTAAAGTDRSVECTSPSGAMVPLDAGGSADPENNIALFGWRRGGRTGEKIGSSAQVNVTQAFGTTQTYFLTVLDAFGQIGEDTTSVAVVDTTAPTITGVTATPNTLGPPNHKMVPVTVVVAAQDLCSPVGPFCQITSVSSNEAVNGRGDGNTISDWQITGNLTVNLRAERSGKGSGRVYTLAVECSDPTGNSSLTMANVTVAHDQR